MSRRANYIALFFKLFFNSNHQRNQGKGGGENRLSPWLFRKQPRGAAENRSSSAQKLQMKTN